MKYLLYLLGILTVSLGYYLTLEIPYVYHLASSYYFFEWLLGVSISMLPILIGVSILFVTYVYFDYKIK